jgi:ubiquinone/menaquinone biosynthesis C-methylase UbiE
MQKHSITVKALDVGCGTGVYTEEILKSSQICVGLDLSENMIRYAKKRQEGLNLVLADAHNLPFRDECFNLVVSVGLLEYVQRNVVLKEIARTMKKRAFLMVVTPNKYSAFRLPIKFFSKVSKRDYTAKESSFKEMLYSSYKMGLKLIWYKMNDGLIFLPNSLDRIIGNKVYSVIEKTFKSIFGKNPLSNVMLFLLQKSRYIP